MERFPPGRQHRAILGDPPIDWGQVHTRADYQKWLELRDSHPASVVRREILSKGRRALILYGSGHLQRKQQATNYQMDSPLAQTAVSLLDRAGVRTFIVITVGDSFVPAGAAFGAWPTPSLALIRGTTAGAESVAQGSIQRVAIRKGEFVPIQREQWIALRMEEQFDALLYLGPSSTVTTAALSPTVCADPGYVETRLKRIALVGLPPAESEQLTNFCATAPPR